jgi:hypothetical protein
MSAVGFSVVLSVFKQRIYDIFSTVLFQIN